MTLAPRGTDAIALFAHPNLDEYRMLAEELLRVSQLPDDALAPELVHARSTRDHRATPLHYIAANGHEGFRQRTPQNAVAIGEFLLASGGEPDAHAQALTWAATFGHADEVKVMLPKGIDPSGEDADASALRSAAAYGPLDIGELLVQQGASLEKRNSDGATVLDGMVWHALRAPDDRVDYSATARRLLALGARTDVYPEMRGYVDLVLAGQRGGGCPAVETTG